MQEHGQRASGAATGGFVALGVACALVPALAMWGFTVDDALIPVRYAHNLATGAGYRFDAHGPSTDGVTPLPWAFVLAALGGSDAMTILVRAKMLGIVAWAASAGALGARVAVIVRGGGRVHVALAAVSLLVVGLAFPIGAWAASGMETGVATGLATLAVTRIARPRQAAALSGAVAALRPEMVVWALALGIGAAIAGREREREGEGGREREREGGSEGDRGAREALGAAGLTIGPFVVCAAIRLFVFGRPAPLAVFAKPSDLAHGAMYAAAAALVVLTPLLAFAPFALMRTRGLGEARVVVVAFVAHVLVVIAVGGDWMPYARLMVPVAPSLVIAFVAVARSTSAAWSGGRLVAAFVLGALVAIRAAPAGRAVQGDRADLVARARPVLASAQVVAALDVGWVSASTDARIVDLAGLTDPSIALLPGGHTSKRVDVSMLLDRGVDTVVVYSERRVVESRIVGSDLFAERFEAAEKLPLGSRGASYTVYRRRPGVAPAE